MKEGVLYLIPTVLAAGTEQRVLSPQVREVIAATGHFMVENVRTARRFISALQLGRPIEALHFYVLDKDTSAVTASQYLKILQEGEDMGLLSEAGSPGIADPGALAVALAHEQGIRVVPLSGPSAILLALMGSGMSGQAFAFHGYLPIEKEARQARLRQLEAQAYALRQTQIFMETPFRNNALLSDVLGVCRIATLLCIACNLTAPDELIRTLPVAQWRMAVPDLHKKPCVFLLFPAK